MLYPTDVFPYLKENFDAASGKSQCQILWKRKFANNLLPLNFHQSTLNNLLSFH